MMMPPDMRQVNIQRYNDRRFRAYCCGFIDSSSNDVIVCFCWAAISFYFAITAFLQQSPFYSYVQTVPLVAFGAINLLFGVVTLCGIVVLLLRPRIHVRIIGMYQSKKTVYAITANAIAVLAVTLVNFILFAKDKAGFFEWCITSSQEAMKNAGQNIEKNGFNQNNCQRLFDDEIKWSFLCLALMSVVYIHWILIIAARTTYQFFSRIDLPPQPLPTEFANLPPASKDLNQQLYKNARPSQSFWKTFLTHKQYSSSNDNHSNDIEKLSVPENTLYLPETKP